MSSTAEATVPMKSDARVIGLVGLAHCISHFSQLLLAPLFPLLKEEFQVSYAELGLLMTVFFIVSCCVQAMSGFVVDRYGPVKVLLGGLGLIGLGALGLALSPAYGALMACSVLIGIGNGVFHPVDYTVMNRRISAKRLGFAYSVHGVTGSLGWALAPALLVPVAAMSSWRVALGCAAAVVAMVWLLVWLGRGTIQVQPMARPSGATGPAGSSFEFLRIPAVWMCMVFFLFYAGSLSGVQTFAPEAARLLHDVPLELAGLCLSIYMVASAGGMLTGGFLTTDPANSERIVGIAFGCAAAIALLIGLATLPAWLVPPLFGLMGFVTGIAQPSRDMLVKRAAPENATGRVYGVVYSGLDIGQAIAPLVYGHLMDLHHPAGVWVMIAIVQGVLIVSAFNVRKVRRTTLAAA